MTTEQKDLIYSVFVTHFIWMDAQDVENLYLHLEEFLLQDIEETADADFTNGDVCIAIRRALFKKLGIEA